MSVGRCRGVAQGLHHFYKPHSRLSLRTQVSISLSSMAKATSTNRLPAGTPSSSTRGSSALISHFVPTLACASRGRRAFCALSKGEDGPDASVPITRSGLSPPSRYKVPGRTRRSMLSPSSPSSSSKVLACTGGTRCPDAGEWAPTLTISKRPVTGARPLSGQRWRRSSPETRTQSRDSEAWRQGQASNSAKASTTTPHWRRAYRTETYP